MLWLCWLWLLWAAAAAAAAVTAAVELVRYEAAAAVVTLWSRLQLWRMAWQQ
ncbi:MAG: hypothetical protein KF799_11850 [Bdellovibrionales bacterium]|nr:hypothetical protein [Bdellovibrionales bacterium]